MSMADMYNHGLTKTSMCGNWVDSVEDAYYLFFKCPKHIVELLFSSHKYHYKFWSN